MHIAGLTARIHGQFESTAVYFREYLTDAVPELTFTVTQADRTREQELAWAEARQEGIRPRTYTGAHLERAAIRRKFVEALLHRRTISLHGSTVAVDGRAYLFTAKCGTGKSTHTRLWCGEFGSRAVMVNDDKPFLQITGAGTLAWGNPWAGKHGLHTPGAYPLAGICILTRGAENRIRRISPEEARDFLLAQAEAPLEPGTEEIFSQLTDNLLNMIPLWQMQCNRESDAARIAYAAMACEA